MPSEAFGVVTHDTCNASQSLYLLARVTASAHGSGVPTSSRLIKRGAPRSDRIRRIGRSTANLSSHTKLLPQTPLWPGCTEHGCDTARLTLIYTVFFCWTQDSLLTGEFEEDMFTFIPAKVDYQTSRTTWRHDLAYFEIP
jgi:hypothetical protein